MANLTHRGRERMKGSQFALPRERKYPINDLAHARNALARVAAFGNADEKFKVRKAVFSRFPQLKDGKAYQDYKRQKTARSK